MMDDLFPYAINKRFLSECGLRVYLYLQFMLRINKHPEGYIHFSRKRLSLKTGLSYNAVKRGLKELEKLNMVSLDPTNKGYKNILILLPKDKFNWDLISEFIKNEKARQDSPSKDDSGFGHFLKKGSERGD